MSSAVTTEARQGELKRHALVCLVIVFCLIASACGSRRTDEELISAVRGTGPDPSTDEATVGNDPASTTAVPQDETAQGEAPSDRHTDQGGGGPVTTDDNVDSRQSSDAGGQSSDPVARGAGGPSCTGNEKALKIGMVGTQSGIVGSLMITMTRGMQAWVAHTNAQGGLNCHPVEYMVVDDGGDPSRHQSLVRQLVEERGVVAFANMGAPVSGQSSVNYLEENQIPVIGSDTGSPWALTSPMYFPQSIHAHQSFESVIAAAADAALPQGKTKLGALYCVEAPLCSSVGPKLDSYAKKYGLQLVYAQEVTIVAPDYTSQCQAAQRDGAEILFVAVDPNAVKRIARSCRSVNFNPLYVTVSMLAPPTIADDPNLDGLVGSMGVITPMISGNAALDEYQQAMARYAPGIDAKHDPGGIIGWTSGKLLEAAATHLSDTPTSADLLKGLWAIKNNDLGGLTTPLTFNQDQPTTPKFCYWTFQFSGGEPVLGPTGSERVCP